ncbi:hypothetical protein [Nonlabens ulvanivorans]|uniref:Opacity protein-like surface antigen n=3 Tax=Nonlabens ulvanivorans TaxID=906888 RepID=A0ABX5E3E2_NONUL|nr:hypothetical protein [Nonlabens ulvanivorans]PRX13456.1 opacity protein-like surface antigen [Nonlabens ulvanivorans]
MSFNFRFLIIAITLLLSNSMFAQTDSISDPESSRLRRNVTDLFIQRGTPMGDNYIGNGLSGGLGFGIRTQAYLYKGLYIGAALSNDFMKVNDVDIVGNYDRATKFNAYLFAGYDYRFTDLWHVTGDIGIGYSQNKNRQTTAQGGAKFRDSGTLFRFTTSIEYEFTPAISVFASPSFEMVDYKIATAPALSNAFNSGNYFNVAIGIRISDNIASIDRLKRDIDRIEAIPEDQRGGVQRIRLKIYKKRLARRLARKN